MSDRLSRQGKKILVTLGVFIALAVGTVLSAHAAPPSPGAVLEGAKPPAAAQQPAEAKGAAITVEGRQPAATDNDHVRIAVQGFRISGEPPLPADELLSLVGSAAGKEMSLRELNALADRLTQHMRKRGYLVAFAFIPAQDIKDGRVEIAVVPGKYGKVKIAGNGRFDRDKLRAMLYAARPMTVIAQAPLERALLMLSDLNGVSIKATLSPGQEAGTADLILEVTDTVKWRGAAYADNWGNRYTSRNRLGVQMTAGNIGGRGDDFSLGGLVTADNRMNNYNLGYSFLVGDDGMRLSVRYSKVDYSLGENYADLGATGEAKVAGLEISYPLIRSRGFSLKGNIGYEDKRLQDDQSATANYQPKRSHAVSFGLAGSSADTWLGGGYNSFSLTHYRGRLSILEATGAANDAITAQTAGYFTKTAFVFRRQQYVADNLNLNLDFTGQVAGKNLDSSEKLFLGGADGVRAFPQGEAAGDTGYKLTGELRWRLAGLSTGRDSVFLAGFYDYGSIMVNRSPWAGAGDSNRRSLMGAGLGVLWICSPDFSLRLDYAWKIGQEHATADKDKNGRLWLQGVRYF